MHPVQHLLPHGSVAVSWEIKARPATLSARGDPGLPRVAHGAGAGARHRARGSSAAGSGLSTLISSILVVDLAACGGGIGAHDLLRELLSAQCDHAVECGEMPDKATCMTSRALQNNIALTIVSDIDNGTIRYDASLGAACVDSLRSQGCTPSSLNYFDGFPHGPADSKDPCIQMFSGTIGAEDTCTVDEQCADHGRCSGLSCDPRTSCCNGYCEIRPIVEIGDDCASASCAEDAYCDWSTSRCTSLEFVTSQGGACNYGHACVPPLLCVFRSRWQPDLCVLPANTGEDCRATYGRCIDSRDYCNFDSRTCTRYAAVGESCKGGSCVPYAWCVDDSICVARPGAGQPCSIEIGSPGCIGDLLCVDSKCRIPPAGTACP